MFPRIAASTYCSSVCMVRRRHRVRGATWTMARAASMPFRPGMMRSSTATSGWCFSARLTAPRPSAASATTVNPWGSRRARSASRNSWWSSARRRLDILDQRHGGLELGAPGVTLAQAQSAADGREPLADADEPDARALGALLRQPVPVVVHRAADRVARALHRDPGEAGAGVSDDVGQRLLHGAIERELDLGR